MVRRTRLNKGGRIAASCVQKTPGGTLEKAAMIANHASTRTTQLYARRNDEVSLHEVERILN